MNEDSEVAANVFSSMLGVASNAPQYPAQQQPQQQQGNYPAYPGGQPINNTPQGMQNQQGYNPQGYGMNQMAQQNYGYPTMQSGQGKYYPGMGPQNQPYTPQQTEKPTKKVGLFEAIRNFFFRQ